MPGLLTIDEIIAQVFKIEKKSLFSKTRIKPTPEARQFGMWYRNKYNKQSLVESARHYNRDHSTAIFACRTVKNLIYTDSIFREKAQRALLMLEQIKQN